MVNVTTEGTHTFAKYFQTSFLTHDYLITTILLVSYTSIFVLGLIGNLVVIIVICKNPALRTVTNIFILNLAVADLFVIIFCIPCTLLTNIFTPWMLSNFLCKAIPFIQGVSVCASVYSLVAISLDRCLDFYKITGAVPKGLSYLQAKLLVLSIWMFGVLINLPLPFVFQVVYSMEDVDYGYPYCWEVWSNPDDANTFFVTVSLQICFALPLLALLIINLCIWLNMRKIAALALAQQLQLRYDKHGVTKMLWVISVSFVLYWAPLMVLMTKLKLFGPLEIGSEEYSNSLQEILVASAQLMGSCNSCVNPVLYAFNSARFRQCLAEAFRKDNQEEEEHNNNITNA